MQNALDREIEIDEINSGNGDYGNNHGKNLENNYMEDNLIALVSSCHKRKIDMILRI